MQSGQSLAARCWPYLLVSLLCLPAAWPYLGGDIPRSNDTLTHLYRAVELDQLIRSSILFPRWGPDFAHGYGYPIFNYFAYFSHYLIVLFHFTGLSLLWAVRAAYILALCGAGVSAFGLGKVFSSNNRGGFITALAYVYSPYLLYTAHVRGGLPENLALAFLPLAVLGIYRSLTEISFSKWLLITALAIAGFIASHVGMAIQYLPLLSLFGIHIIVRRLLAERNWRNLLLGFWGLGFGIFLGLALTAFLWLPSVAELSYVQFQTAFARAGLLYTENFLQLSDLFAYPRLPVYLNILNPPVIRALSIPATVVAFLGLLTLAQRRITGRQRLDYIVFFIAFLLTAGLTLNLSKPLWDVIGLLQRSTFPWRFLGPASLLAAVLAGMAFSNWGLGIVREMRELKELRELRWVGLLGFWILGFGIFLFSLPFLFPPREPALENPTLADLARYEIPPLLVATTTTGEYTPIWVKEFPDTRAQQATLLEGRQPERLEAPGAQILEHRLAEPAHDVYSYTSASDSTATYHAFYFPGWEARLDGQPLPLSPSDPHGLLTFTLPGGAHTLDLRFGSTLVRTAAGWISAAALLIIIGLLVIRDCRLVIGDWGLGRVREMEEMRELKELRELRWVRGWKLGFWDLGFWKFGFSRQRLGFGLLGFGILILGFWLLGFGIFSSAPPTTQHPLSLDFGGELALLGYDHSILSTQHSALTLIWQAQHPLGVPYGFNLRLTDERSLIHSDTNIERPRDWRFYPGTDQWPPDQYILDSYILKPLRGAPPGAYQLEVIAYRLDTLQALSTQRIGEYVVDAPTNEPLGKPLLTLDKMALIGIQADRADAAPGDPYRLTLLWQAFTDSPPEQDVQLELVDSSGAIIYTRAESVSPTYSPARWKQGDMLRQEVFFRLPARLPGGEFHWRVNGQMIQTSLLTLSLHPPARSFVSPPLAHPQTVVLTPAIKLLGWNEKIEGQKLTVDLVWQATQETTESYRVFLHLLDADGNLVSQSDGEPANWTRPTSGWWAGEVVLDLRTLTVPGPGEYTLRVGWVNEEGERITEPVELGSVRIS